MGWCYTGLPCNKLHQILMLPLMRRHHTLYPPHEFCRTGLPFPPGKQGQNPTRPHSPEGHRGGESPQVKAPQGVIHSLLDLALNAPGQRRRMAVPLKPLVCIREQT